MDIKSKRLQKKPAKVSSNNQYFILENIPQAILIFDQKFAVRYLNKNAAFLLKTKVTEVNNVSIMDLFTGLSTATSRKKLVLLFDKGREITLSCEYKTSSKKKIKLNWRINPAPAKNRFIAVIEEKKLKPPKENILVHEESNQAAKSEKIFRSMIENSSDGISLIDKDGKSIYHSPNRQTLTGYSNKEMANNNGYETVYPEEKETVKQWMNAVISGSNDIGACQFKARKKDGTTWWVEAKASNKLDDPDIQAIIINYRDITNRKLAEEKFRKAFYNSPDAIIITKQTTGEFLEANEGFERMFGYSLNEVLYKSILDLNLYANSSDRKKIIDIFKKEGRVRNHKILTRKKNGKLLTVLISLEGIEISGENCFVTTIRDITEVKRIEKELAEKTDLLEHYFTHALDLFCIADLDGHFIKLNKAWEIALGYKTEELEGKKFMDYVHPDDIESTINAVSLLTNKEEVRDFVNRYQRKDGSYCWIEWRSFPIGNKIYAVARDITERKKTEEILLRNAEENKWLMKSMANAFAIWGTCFDENYKLVDIRFLYINDAYERISGLKLNEVQNKGVREVWPETEESWYEVYGEVAISGIPKSFEMYHKPTNGIYACRAYRPWDTTDRVCCIFEDITEKKHSEETLRKSAEKIRAMFETMADGILFVDLDGNITEANNAAVKMFGFEKREELLGQGLFHFISESNYEQATKDWQNTLETGYSDIIEYKFRKKNGEEFDGNLNSVVLKDEQGKPAGFVVLTRDITKRKLMEEALWQNERQISLIYDTIADMLFSLKIISGEYYFESVNQSLLTTMGLRRDQIINKKLQDVVLQSVFIRAMKVNEEAIRKKVTLRYETVLESLVGNIYCEMSITPVFDKLDNCAFLICSIHNITDRKKAEEALHQNEQQLKLAIEGSGVGLWDWKIQTGELKINERWAEICGYTLRELEPISIKTWEGLVHEDDLKKSNMLLEDHFKGKSSIYECEVRLKHKDGGWIWILDRGMVTERDLENKPVRITGTHLDITERKKTEEALEEIDRKKTEYLERLNEAQRIARIGSWDWNLQTDEFWWSDETYRIFDVTPQEYTPSIEANRRFVYLDDLEKYHNSFRQSLKTGEPLDIDVRLKTKDGTIKYSNMKGRMTYDRNNKPVKFNGTIMDITERKRIEESLQISEDRFRRIFEEGEMGIAQLAPDLSYMNVNRAFCSIVGYSREELLKETYFSIINPDDVEDDIEITKSLWIGEIPFYKKEKKYIQKNSDIVWVLSALSLVRNKNGNPEYYLEMVQDISELKKAEKAILERTQELERFEKVVVGRELKMIELKQKIAELEKKINGSITDGE